jgi:hypothetical protein
MGRSVFFQFSKKFLTIGPQLQFPTLIKYTFLKQLSCTFHCPMESDLSPLAEGISVTFHYLVVIMRHWDDNKGMERDPNLGNFCLSVGISQNGGGGHQMMGCQMPGIPSGVWRHMEVVVQTLHLSAQKLIMRELQWVFMIFFIGMSSSCT